ncbi:MAG: UbiD family decarboxylase [Deltaproteobacteria bacterium]|nr:UbiD family decarboxylase [Deltaproteobacteria bacterium]
MNDLRTYMDQLANRPGNLLTTEVSVDPKLELTRIVYMLEKQNKRPAVFFKKVRGSDLPVLTNLFGNRERLALAMDTTEEKLNQVYREREKRPIPPVIVASGPIQERVMTGDEVDLTRFPIVHHNSGDAGPYITAGVTTVKDPDTGIRNAGMYRFMLRNRNQLSVYLAEANHVYYIYRKYCEKKQNMPIAITIGAHPVFYLGSLSFGSIDTDEYAVIGGLSGGAMQVVKCKSVDLEVPASGEICLEGYIDWEKREPEGPFGELHTLYGETMNQPVVTITAVTMRHDPIYHDVCSGDVEHQLMGGIPRLGQIYNQVKVACPGIRDVYMPPSGYCRTACYVSIKKYVEGEPANGAAAVFSADPFVRHAVFVDEDVNIFDDYEVLKAVNLNMDISKCFIIHNAKGSQIDPASRSGVVTKIGIDATRPLKSKFARINFNEGIGGIDLAKIFKNSAVKL